MRFQNNFGSEIKHYLQQLIKTRTMDSHYIIERLKSTPFKYPTVALLKTRLNNLDERQKEELLISLRKQIHMAENLDIQQPLSELVYHLPIAS
jgi:hypothetical protein